MWCDCFAKTVRKRWSTLLLFYFVDSFLFSQKIRCKKNISKLQFLDRGKLFVSTISISPSLYFIYLHIYEPKHANLSSLLYRITLLEFWAAWTFLPRLGFLVGLVFLGSEGFESYDEFRSVGRSGEFFWTFLPASTL